MRHIIFEDADCHPVALLIKPTAFSQPALVSHYVTPLHQYGITPDQVVAMTLKYEKDKAPVKLIKEYLEALLPALDSVGTRFLYVTDGAYFKVLTKKPKAEPHWGYILPCAISGYTHMQVVLGLNHQALIYNPDQQAKLNLSLKALGEGVQGTYQALGQGIIHAAEYPGTLEAIEQSLLALHAHSQLTCDIEAFSLRHYEAGIGTVGFAKDEHQGIAFACDYKPLPEKDEHGNHGLFCPDPQVRKALRTFFETYQGILIWHNSVYDLKVLIYTLWMKDLADTAGLLEGLGVMTRLFDDTKIIAYLATNSTAGNELGLKALAHEFAGNYAQSEIKDIRRIPLSKLLQYNLVDCLSTWYVWRKYYPVMCVDQQESLYQGLMKESLRTIIQLELTGMPMDPARIQEVKAILLAEMRKHEDIIHNNPVVQQFTLWVQTQAMKKANAKLKTKQHPLEKFKHVQFNPGSPLQLQELLYTQLGLPVIDYTDTKQPATGGDTLEKLIHRASDPDTKALLAALIDRTKVDKLLTAFIPSFERAVSKGDGRVYLFGSFNLGGTVSGRLSSSDPNLQQIPAGNSINEYKAWLGKLIKSCFTGPSGWLFAGADFSSLEDYISALTTRDPNKLAVYERGFDGHCLRAAYYFRDSCPEIDLEDPISVNSIKKLYPALRQDSKGPTFALTYQGTWHTLVTNLGFEEEKAKAIEQGYHELYKVSDEYVQARLKQASIDGYVEVAFGLRVRTPLLKQVIFGSSNMPFAAAAEGRTAGNALGQSYGLLNNRAANAFLQKVWASPYRYDILPVALIHDAIYLLIRDRADVVEWANRELPKEMAWQELPEIQHPTVKINAALDLFWPNWGNPVTLVPGIDQTSIITCCQKARDEYLASH